MSAAKFKVGDRVRFGGDHAEGPKVYTVALAEPDQAGWIVTLDESGVYCQAPQKNYELAPQRFTVEIRAPKKGERYLSSFDSEVTTALGDDHCRPLPVIVDEVTS